MAPTRTLSILFSSLVFAGACGFDSDGEEDGSYGKGDGFDFDAEVQPLRQCIDRQLPTIDGFQSEREVRKQVIDLVQALEGDSEAIDALADRGINVADIDSIEALVAALPEEVRTQPLFFTETRAMARIYPREERAQLNSLDPETPRQSFSADDGSWCVDIEGESSHCLEARVLLPSVEGDVIGSFTTHPNSPAADRFELIVFNPPVSEITLWDVDFSGGSPEVTENPDTCLRCHGGFDGSINYRFDPYRFWAFATPFNEDHIRGAADLNGDGNIDDSEEPLEMEWFKSFLDRGSAAPDGRLGQLFPKKRAEFPVGEQLLQSLLEPQSTGASKVLAHDAQVDFSNNDSPALNLSHQLLERNACRIGSDLARRSGPEFEGKPDNYQTVKYAAAGALLGCEQNLDIHEFFSESGGYTAAFAAEHFEALQEGIDPGTGSFSHQTYLDEIRSAQMSLLNDRLSRRYDHFADFAGRQRALNEIEAVARQEIIANREPGFGITDFEKFPREAANARYLLEPLGVDVGNWSMAVDPTHHSHVEFLFAAYLSPALFDTIHEVVRGDGDSDALPGAENPIYGAALSYCTNLTTKSMEKPGGGNAKPRDACRQLIRSNKGPICERLAEKSREAFASISSEELARRQLELLSEDTTVTSSSQPYRVESMSMLEELAAERARCTPSDRLASEAQSVLGDKCGNCHDTGYVDGSPLIPFRSTTSLIPLVDLERIYNRERTSGGGLDPIQTLFDSPIGTTFGSVGKAPYAFEYIGLAARVWDRINRHPLVHGAMPPAFDGGEPLRRLTTEQKVAVRAHQLQVIGLVPPPGLDIPLDCEEDDDDLDPPGGGGGLPDL